MIGGAPYGDWYEIYAMEGLELLREENADRRICFCASLRSGSGVKAVASKSEAFCAILEALPVVDTSAECRWRREDSGGMTRLEFEALE